MKKIVLGIVIALTATLMGVGVADNVNAVSPYDDIIYTPQNIQIGEYPNDILTFDDADDFMNNYFFNIDETFYNNSNPNFTSGLGCTWSFYESVINMIQQENYPYIIENTPPSSSNTGGIDIYILNSPNVTSYWNSSQQSLTLSNLDTAIVFQMSSSGNTSNDGNMSLKYCNDDGPYLIHNVVAYNPFIYLIASHNINISYPEDYEGETLPNYIYTPPVEPVDYTPNWYVSGAIDWKVQIHDINFNTFDNVPFLCDDDLAPVLHWEIWDRGDPDDPNDHVLLDDGYFSATAQIDYQLPKIDELKHYRIIGYYECGDAPIFDQSSHHDFKVDAGGNLDRSIALDCIIPEFPFVNFRHCQLIIEDTINILLVGSHYSEPIKNPSGGGGGWTIDTNNCHTLTTVGDWLNLSPSQRYICPNFPSSIRNIISPFVGFFLGLGTVIFIARRASGDSQ